MKDITALVINIFNMLNLTTSTGKVPPPLPPAPEPQKKQFCAKADFHDDDKDMVDLLKDEEVEEIEPDKGGWTKVLKKDGKQGLVPTSFLSGESKLV